MSIFLYERKFKNYHFSRDTSQVHGYSRCIGIIEQTTDIKFEIKGNTVIVKKDLTRSDR